MLRSQAHEAVASLRGHIRAFVFVAEEALRRGAKARIYLEAFEDIQTIDSGRRTATQLKHRKGSFSITRDQPCAMLDRWARAHMSDPSNTVFMLLSSQTPASTFDRKPDFADYAMGCVEHDSMSAVIESIRNTLGRYGARRNHETKYPYLTNVLEPDAFEAFWLNTVWRFDLTKVDEAVQSVEENLRKRYSEDPTVRRRLLSWIGAVALSACSEDVEARCWSLRRFEQIDHNADGPLRALIDKLERLEQVTADEQAELVTSIGMFLQEQERAHHVPMTLPLRTSPPAGATSQEHAYVCLQQHRGAYTEGRLSDARRAIEQARSLDPCNATILYRYVLTMSRCDRSDLARRALAQWKHDGLPVDAIVVRAEAELARSQGEIARALEQFRSINPQTPEDVYQAGLCHLLLAVKNFETRHIVNATAALMDARAKRPDHWWIAVNLALARRLQYAPDELLEQGATELLNTAVRKHPQKGVAYLYQYFLGVITQNHEAMERLESTVRELPYALEIGTQHYGTIEARVAVLYRDEADLLRQYKRSLTQLSALFVSPS